MKIKFLGTGSAFCLNNFNSSYLITNNGKNLLFDAGTDIRFALKESRLSYKDIDSVYISHLHADHCGGIEYLAFCSFFDPNKKKINLIGDFHILMEGWEHVWSGGLNPHSGQYINEHSLSEYFTTYYLYRRYNYIKNLIWENLALTVVQTNHNIDNLKTFGLLIEDLSSHKRVLITSDAIIDYNIVSLYDKVDVIIQDCETSSYKSGVHAHYTELRSLSERIKSKMILTHYQDNILNDDGTIRYDWKDDARNNKFEFAVKGNSLII